jgi:hypothetical protein
MKLLYTTILACMLAGALTAQNTITLNWIMTDEQYEPLSGVSLYRESGDLGTISDTQGNISLTVRLGDVLVVRILGYETKKFKVSSKTQLDSIFVLAIEPILLPEILISSYGRYCCRCITIDVDTAKRVATTSLSSIQEQPIIDLKSVEIIAKSIAINFYPNPTNSFLNLQSEKPLGQVDLYNLNGQKLKIYNFQQQFQAEIDLSGQPKGTYVLRSSQGWVEKVVKL